MFLRFFSCVFLALIFTFSSLSSAGESAAPQLPDSLTAVLSIKSPQLFLSDLDEFVASVLEGTPQTYDVGMLPVLAHLFLPAPIVEADLDQEIHVLFLKSPDIFSRVAFYLSADDYQDYIKRMALGGDVIDDKGEIAQIRSASGYTFYLAASGKGKVIAASSAQDVRDAQAVLGQIQLHAQSDASATLQFAAIEKIDLGGDIVKAIDKAIENTDNQAGDLAEDANTLCMDGEMIQKSFHLLSNAHILLNREIQGISSGKIELKVDEKNLIASMLLYSTEGTLLSEVIKEAKSLANNVYPLAQAVDKSAGALSVFAPAHNFLVGKPEYLDRLSSALADALLPGEKEQIEQVFKTILVSGPEELIGSLTQDNIQINYLRVKDPEALLRGLLNGVKLLNLSASKFFKNPNSQAPFILAEEKQHGDFKYWHIHLSPDGETAFQKLIDHDTRLDYTPLENASEKINQLFALSGDVLVVMSGQANIDDFAKAIANAKGSGEPFVDMTAAKEMLSLIPNRQISFGLLKVDFLSRLALDSIMEQFVIIPEGRAILEKAKEDLFVSDAVFGFSHGIQGDGYVFQCAATAKGVNDMAKNYFMITEREDALYSKVGSDADGADDELGEESE